MFYIKKIKGAAGKILTSIYIIALLFYVLCDAGFVQINTVSTSLIDIFNIPIIIIWCILIIISFIVILGGLKRVSNVLSKLVPIMCLFYILLALIVIIINIKI